MCIEWKDNKVVVGKSGDLLLARRSQETSPNVCASNFYGFGTDYAEQGERFIGFIGPNN